MGRCMVTSKDIGSERRLGIRVSNYLLVELNLNFASWFRGPKEIVFVGGGITLLISVSFAQASRMT